MVIAVNTKYFLKASQQDYSTFIYDYFGRIAHQQPQHTFIYFSDGAFDTSCSFTENVIPVTIASQIKGRIVSAILYNLKTASLLKKYKADIYVNADSFNSLFTKIPLAFILHDPFILSDNKFVKKNHVRLYKKYLPTALKKAKVIFTESGFSKNLIIQRYKTGGQKCVVVYNGVSASQSTLCREEKEKIKTFYAQGNEYFIFFGDTSRSGLLLNLLKAFSLFKKRQKSGMQLLIVTNDELPADFAESLKLFKYKNDISIIDNLAGGQIKKLALAAYSVIFFPPSGGVAFAASKILGYNIPLITTDSVQMPELFGEAALYANFNDPQDIAEKLMSLFKDEKLRTILIEKGKITLKKYDWESVSQLLWQSLLKAIS